MTPSTLTTCSRCGALLPAATPSDTCPACGQPLDPDATWHPDPAAVPLAPVDMPSRVPVGWLVSLATLCAVMGLALGLWLNRQHEAPARRAEAPLPPLPAPGPALARPMPASRYYPAPTAPPGQPPLPPARVTPPMTARPWPIATGPTGTYRYPVPGSRLPVTPSLPHPLIPSPPMKAAGMATVHVQNPSSAVVEVTLKGEGSQSGVVGPRTAVDLLVPPGRYDIALHGAARTQHFYDAPLATGDVLELVYDDSPGERPSKPARGE